MQSLQHAYYRIQAKKKQNQGVVKIMTLFSTMLVKSLFGINHVNIVNMVSFRQDYMLLRLENLFTDTLTILFISILPSKSKTK